MNDVSKAARQLLEALKAERDDLKVQLHLGAQDLKAEVEQEWSGLEHQWAELKAEIKSLNRKAGSALDDLEDDWEELGLSVSEKSESALNAIHDGYVRLRQKLGVD